jgi:hypothetical protein
VVSRLAMRRFENGETIQITWTRATLSLCLRHYFLTLPSEETPVRSQRLPSRDEIEIHRMGRSDLLELGVN